jgi:PAS domain S-box-containing protein
VDDDASLRRYFTLIFQREGFAVQEAATAGEALRLVADRPDLVVLDIQLPDLSGFEVCRRIKADPATASIPVLHLSGEFISSEDRAHGLGVGADGYLLKPVDPHELLASVRSLLRIKHTEAVLRESHDLLRAIAEGTTDALFVKDLQGRYLLINTAGARFLGKSVAEVLGKDDTELFSPDTAREIMAHDRAVIAAGETQTFEDIGTAAGVTRTYLSTKGPYRDQHGQVIGLIGISHDITARKHAEQALEEARRRYQRLLESVTSYVYTVHFEAGRPAATVHGPGCVAVTGYTAEEYAANPRLWYEMVHDDDRPAVLAQAARVHAGEPAPPLEHRLRHMDGSVRWVTNTPVARRDEQGRLASYDGLIADITERKRAEEALRQAEERYRGIFEHATEGIFQTTREGGFLTANPALARMLGFPSSDELIQAVTDIGGQLHVAPERRREFLRLLDAHGSVQGFEAQVYRKDGSILWISINARAIRDARGALLRFEGIAEDITERKRAVELLRQSEERYRSVVEGSLQGIVIHQDGKIQYANRAFAHMFGYASPDDMIGRSVDLLIGPDELPDLLVRRGAVLRGETLTIHPGWHGVRRDGSRIWIQSTGHLMLWEGQPAVVAFFIDITERRRAEEMLQSRARQQAAVADLGQRALASTNLTALMDEAVASVAQTLEVGHCGLFELLPDRQSLLLQAGVGWTEGCVGEAAVMAGTGSLAGYTLLHQAPVVVADLRAETRFRVPTLLHDHRLVSAVSVAVPAADQPFGVLEAYTTGPRAFAQDDIHYLQAVAHVLGTAIDRRQAEERLLAARAEFRVARRIQQRLFPTAVPRMAGFDIGGQSYGFDISGASYPAEATGGDYFDYIPLIDGGLGIVVGDVSGHGVGPALLMAETRAYLRALARSHAKVGDILTRANEVLAPDIEDGRFITLLLARLDPRTRQFEYASAGHTTGYVLNAAGRVKFALPSLSIPLGVLPDGEFSASEPMALEAGDLVLLFTDGVVEARSPDDVGFGIQRALDIVRVYRADPARLIVANLYHAVRAFTQNTPQNDDITAVVVRVG